MTETILDSLVVKIRADSSQLRGQLNDLEKGFDSLDQAAANVAGRMTGAFENFARAGELSFAGLKRAALSALSDIANSAIQSGLDSLFGSGGGSGIGGAIGNIASSLLFGRAGGGTVGARQPYMVGERGPELFVPDGPGRILPGQDMGRGGSSSGKLTNITVNITNQGDGRDMTQRSAGQVAVAVRRAMDRADRNL